MAQDGLPGKAVTYFKVDGDLGPVFQGRWSEMCRPWAEGTHLQVGWGSVDALLHPASKAR